MNRHLVKAINGRSNGRRIQEGMQSPRLQLAALDRCHQRKLRVLIGTRRPDFWPIEEGVLNRPSGLTALALEVSAICTTPVNGDSSLLE